MNGPEHYREAERLTEGPDRDSYNFDAEGEENFWRDRMDNLAEAQVHATLALVAAHVDTLTSMSSYDLEWAQVTA